MNDPYVKKLVNSSFYSSKIDIKGKIVSTLRGSLETRGLSLIHPVSRAFIKNSIIEIIGTDEADAVPGMTVNSISYIAFAEIKNGGIVLTGDDVIWNGKIIGQIAGYDDTHMPNHQNTIIKMKTKLSGEELGIKVNDEIIIKGFKNNLQE
jgi:hypothetical protein